MLYFIPSNPGKFQEAAVLIPELKQLEIDLAEIQEIDPQTIIKHKLEQAFSHHSGHFIVEDTSLYLSATPGLPGPLIRWFLKTIGNEGLVKIADNFKNDHAKAETVIGYAKSVNEIYFVDASIQGTIVSPRGKNGFGWDQIFVPEGTTKTFAEMDLAEKNQYSMRRLAIEKLRSSLSKEI